MPFFLQFAQRKKQKKYYQWATYKDQISTVPQQSTAFLFQETSPLNTNITTRSTYDESCKTAPEGL